MMFWKKFMIGVKNMDARLLICENFIWYFSLIFLFPNDRIEIGTKSARREGSSGCNRVVWGMGMLDLCKFHSDIHLAHVL
ncbi:MAG: hypothetical protein D6698_10285 [Gammaproteobacteria bacterium]|nr:MAG: hypothetical protein D6698_10285 [Gammaproteobacteria bacterium]